MTDTAAPTTSASTLAAGAACATPPALAPVRLALPGFALLGLALLAGLVTGALTSVGQTVLPAPFGGLANAVAPWLVVPFAAGTAAAAAARRWGWAAVAGVLACAAQVGGYYLTSHLRGFGVGSSWVPFWLATAAAGGVAAGVAGWSWWRSGDPAARLWWGGRERGLGAAVLVAAWLAEAVVTYAVVLGYVGDAVVFGVVGVLALGLLGVRGRQHAHVVRWLGPALVLSSAGFAALHSV